MAHLKEDAVENAADVSSHGHGEHDHGGKFYFVTWLWLLIITAVEVGLVAIGPARALLVGGLLFLTVLKASIIIANFMHVRFEMRTLLAVVLPPFAAAVIAYYGMLIDFIPSFQ